MIKSVESASVRTLLCVSDSTSTVFLDCDAQKPSLYSACNRKNTRKIRIRGITKRKTEENRGKKTGNWSEEGREKGVNRVEFMPFTERWRGKLEEELPLSRHHTHYFLPITRIHSIHQGRLHRSSLKSLHFPGLHSPK